MKPEELKRILADHTLWLVGDGGQRANLLEADLHGADLRGANLYGANLRGADLRGANLSGANLKQTQGVVYCSVSWPEHGECGRALTAVRIGSVDTYFCGCFCGPLGDLKNYIAKGRPEHWISRAKAATFVSERMAEMTNPQAA